MITSTIARLQAECPSLASVASAEELDALDKGTAPKNGATFVIPFAELGEDNTLMSGGTMQMIETRILVAFLIRRHDDAKGGKRVAGYDAIKGEIEAALIGWMPDGAADPYEFVSARSAPRGGGSGVTIHVQTWKTSRYLRRV